jgi:hypothetical protein
VNTVAETELEGRVRMIEIDHRETRTRMGAMAEDVAAIRESLTGLGSTLDRLNTMHVRFTAILVCCGIVGGAALPVLFRRVFE